MANKELDIAAMEKTTIDTLTESMNSYDMAVDKSINIIKEAKETIDEKARLIAKLEISEESIQMIKGHIREVKAAIGAIDTFRKKFKSETLSHLEPLEKLCKDMKKDVDEILAKKNFEIEEFTNKKKEEKIEAAKSWIPEIGAEYEVDEELLNKVEVKQSWGNTNATQKAIKEDIRGQIESLISEREERQKKIDFYESMIEVENETINTTKLSVEEFFGLIESGADDKEIFSEIKRRADSIRAVEAAMTKKENETSEKENKEVIEAIGNEADEEIEEEAYNPYFLLRVDAPLTEVENVINILAENFYGASLVK